MVCVVLTVFVPELDEFDGDSLTADGVDSGLEPSKVSSLEDISMPDDRDPLSLSPTSSTSKYLKHTLFQSQCIYIQSVGFPMTQCGW